MKSQPFGSPPVGSSHASATLPDFRVIAPTRIFLRLDSSLPSTVATKAAAPSKSAPPSGNSQSGGATWYDAAPSGTCAHRTLPFGTVVTITNLSTGATATCTVHDRGPYVDGLIIDLSKDTFSKLAPLSAGVIQVRITW